MRELLFINLLCFSTQMLSWFTICFYIFTIYGESMVKCSVLWYIITYYGFTTDYYGLLHLCMDLL